jgi:hypothetical protein
MRWLDGGSWLVRPDSMAASGRDATALKSCRVSCQASKHERLHVMCVLLNSAIHPLCLLVQVEKASAGRCPRRLQTATACQPTSRITHSSSSSRSSTAAAAAAPSAAAGPHCATAVSCRALLAAARVRAWTCHHTSWPATRCGMRCAAEHRRLTNGAVPRSARDNC